MCREPIQPRAYEELPELLVQSAIEMQQRTARQDAAAGNEEGTSERVWAQKAELLHHKAAQVWAHNAVKLHDVAARDQAEAKFMDKHWLDRQAQARAAEQGAAARVSDEEVIQHMHAYIKHAQDTNSHGEYDFIK